MSKARIAAEELLAGYHAARGVTSPGQLASELIQRIATRDNRWIGPDQPELAYQILQNACFDVDDLAENHLGVKVHIEPLRAFDTMAGAKVFGLAKPQEKEVWICERAADYEPLYRTTMMHELGHVVLHGGECARTLNYSPEAPRRPLNEREADEFMHSALLPEPILHLGILWVAHLWGLNASEGICRANTGIVRWQWQEKYFPLLISRLCVSLELMALKLKRLGVFSEETVQYQLRHALPNRWMDESKFCPLAKIMRGLKRRIPVPRRSRGG